MGRGTWAPPAPTGRAHPQGERAHPRFTLRKPWPQNGISEVPERPAGPGVGEPSVLPSDRHSGYPEGNAAGGEGCGVSGYQAMEVGRLLEKVI